MTVRESLEQVAEQTGKTPPGLDGPEMPDELAHVWEWFVDLNDSRQYDANGTGRIGYQEIDAWSRLTGTMPRPSEIRILRQLDRLFVRTSSGNN